MVKMAAYRFSSRWCRRRPGRERLWPSDSRHNRRCDRWSDRPPPAGGADDPFRSWAAPDSPTEAPDPRLVAWTNAFSTFFELCQEAKKNVFTSEKGLTNIYNRANLITGNIITRRLIFYSGFILETASECSLVIFFFGNTFTKVYLNIVVELEWRKWTAAKESDLGKSRHRRYWHYA